ncbi:hypothetical protein [Paenibacillus xerothermodurans]|uniref:hypothetical protein n=1 Tax=Paenibacillus xerothermodurans TaxID=1977292 RepID=UPI0014034922|nr:hypothetical protein [Paenibacillus xerothermodurans]
MPEQMDELLAERIRIGAGHLSLKVTRSKSSFDCFDVLVLENTTGFEIMNKADRS